MTAASDSSLPHRYVSFRCAAKMACLLYFWTSAAWAELIKLRKYALHAVLLDPSSNAMQRLSGAQAPQDCDCGVDRCPEYKASALRHS